MIIQKIKDLSLRNKIIATWGTIIIIVLILYSFLFTNIYWKNEEKILGQESINTLNSLGEPAFALNVQTLKYENIEL